MAVVYEIRWDNNVRKTTQFFECLAALTSCPRYSNLDGMPRSGSRDRILVSQIAMELMSLPQPSYYHAVFPVIARI